MRRKIKLILPIFIVCISLSIAIVYALFASQAPSPSGPGPVEIDVQTDKASYIQGENVTFNIYVYNPHNWSVSKADSLTYDVGKDRQWVCISYVGTPTFPPHSKSLFFTHTWNTMIGGVNGTVVQPGNYTFTAQLNGPIDYGPSANCTVTIIRAK